MSDQCEGKSSWPELLGVQGTVAKATIERENSSILVVNIVKEGSFVPLDFRCDRVWVWVDANGNGIVTRVPTIG